MGNGKIVPVPMQFNQLNQFNQMGTIQPQLVQHLANHGGLNTSSTIPGSAADNQRSEVTEMDRKASMASQNSKGAIVGNTKQSRHARRKTAQSTKFNTIAPGHNPPRDYINLDKSSEQNFRDFLMYNNPQAAGVAQHAAKPVSRDKQKGVS